MRKFALTLLAVAFMISVFSIGLARGAPTKQKAFASNAAVEMVSPVLATVPTMIGYDVIQNISNETRDLSIAQNTFDVDTSTARRLSPTRAVNLLKPTPAATCRSGTQ